MTKSQNVILFFAPEESDAAAAAAAFSVAASRLGLPWTVRSHGGSNLPGEHLSSVSVLVCVGDATCCLPAWDGSIERIATQGDERINSLLARLLGGNDAAAVPPPPASPAPPKKFHTVKLSRETAGRKGKGVTVVSDLPLTGDQLKELATRLKNSCGTGGTAKEGRIEIQGDQRDRLAIELEKLGYKVKRAGG